MIVMSPRPKFCKPDPASQDAKHKPYRILCVDDDDDLTRVIKARFHAYRVEVTRARDGRDGLKCAHSHRPDAIITDLGMPNGDGEYLIRCLKSRPSTSRIPVIVISGIEDEFRKAAVHKLGAAAILHKPFKFVELFAELMSHMQSAENLKSDTDFDSETSETVDEPNTQFLAGTGSVFRLDEGGNRLRPFLF